MDHTTYQRPMQLPACYAVLSEEEMTYTDGGFAFTVGNYEITVNTGALVQYLVANTVYASMNLLVYMGQYAFNRASNELQTGLADGLTIGGTINHYWGKMNTQSKIASVGMAALGGYYAYLQIRSMYYSLKNVYDALVNSYNQYQADQQAAAAGLTAA